MLLGSRLEQRREELLLTQDDLAIFIGVRAETVDNWERGFNSPKKGNLQALAKALQTTTDYLEGNTDIATDYSSGGNKCIICGKSVPYGVAKCPECCWRKWPSSFLNSAEQASRRKRSHLVNLASLDRDKARATFVSTSSWGQNVYTTSLDMCTCPDFENRQMPCKHIFRLANELGLFQPEEFEPGEDDYTLHPSKNNYGLTFKINIEDSFDTDKNEVAEDIASTSTTANDDIVHIETEHEVPSQVKATTHSSSVLAILFKIICCCFFGFVAIVLLMGAIIESKTNLEWLCFPVAFAIAGLLTANTAKRHALNGSGVKWWAYGAFIPVVSWIDVVMASSQNRIKGFLKGIAYSIVGIIVFLLIFAQFLPQASTQ